MPITTTPSGGPQGEFSTYTPIYSTTLSSTASSLTFSNIPQTFTDLVIVQFANGSGAGQNSQYQFNGDSASNYSLNFIRYSGSSVDSARVTNQTKPQMDSFAQIASTANSYTGYKMQIMNYSNSTTYKSTLIEAFSENGGDITAHLWRSTSPITSITLFSASTTFTAGSTFTIYGIKAAATQFSPTKALGGDLVVTDGTYAYHVFKTTGAFVPTSSLTADILVVAGGGGGGQDSGGGGGAGGLLGFTSQSLTAQSYTATVGSGGLGCLAYGATQGGITQTNGSDSQFGSLTLVKGGGYGAGIGIGSYPGSYTANTGGSGGGASGGGGPGTGASVSVSGQGYAGGGSFTNGGIYPGGGGGGAGGVGGTPASNSSAGGNGGIGSNVYSSWLTPFSLGVGGYIAGGGAGNSSSPGTGGLGGGGNGSGTSGSGPGLTQHGVSNTGGGGGGGSNGSTSYAGGKGGSGIVIVRYAL
jgi:hypothetical protein